jgi:anti-sigma factor RsiW
MELVPYELLVDLAEGRLPVTEATALRARIANDPLAKARLKELEQLIGLMRADKSVDAPEHVIARATRLMRRPEPARGQPVLRRLIALLTSDSWRTPEAAVGLRSLQAWPRAILLKAGDRELDLQVGPRGERWQLSGQVLGPEAPGTVTLSGPGDRVTTVLNELGEFTMPPVPAGFYTLTVTQDDLEIVVPNLEIGPSSSQR